MEKEIFDTYDEAKIKRVELCNSKLFIPRIEIHKRKDDGKWIVLWIVAYNQNLIKE